LVNFIAFWLNRFPELRELVASRIGGPNGGAGTWPADGKMKASAFGPVAARYVRLEALAVNGTNAAATELAVGARR
jgi:hypothetical protein